MEDTPLSSICLSLTEGTQTLPEKPVGVFTRAEEEQAAAMDRKQDLRGKIILLSSFITISTQEELGKNIIWEQL